MRSNGEVPDGSTDSMAGPIQSRDWWHAYGAEYQDKGGVLIYDTQLRTLAIVPVPPMWLSVIAGPVPWAKHKDEQDYAGVTLDHLGTWDHEPSMEELLSVTPPQFHGSPIIDTTIEPGGGNHVSD